jgi:hypothetical protein
VIHCGFADRFEKLARLSREYADTSETGIPDHDSRNWRVDCAIRESGTYLPVPGRYAHPSVAAWNGVMPIGHDFVSGLRYIVEG